MAPSTEEEGNTTKKCLKAKPGKVQDLKNRNNLQNYPEDYQRKVQFMRFNWPHPLLTFGEKCTIEFHCDLFLE